MLKINFINYGRNWILDRDYREVAGLTLGSSSNKILHLLLLDIREDFWELR